MKNVEEFILNFKEKVGKLELLNPIIYKHLNFLNLEEYLIEIDTDEISMKYSFLHKSRKIKKFPNFYFKMPLDRSNDIIRFSFIDGNGQRIFEIMSIEEMDSFLSSKKFLEIGN